MTDASRHDKNINHHFFSYLLHSLCYRGARHVPGQMWVCYLHPALALHKSICLRKMQQRSNVAPTLEALAGGKHPADI